MIFIFLFKKENLRGYLTLKKFNRVINACVYNGTCCRILLIHLKIKHVKGETKARLKSIKGKYL